MISLVKRLFGRVSPITPAWMEEANKTGLRWERTRLTKEKLLKGWGDIVDEYGTLQMYTQYYCSECDGELTPGPSGGGTNQVCESCKINYGCLPGGLER